MSSDAEFSAPTQAVLDQQVAGRTVARDGRPPKQRAWRSRRSFDMHRPTLQGLIGRYVLLVLLLLLSVGPFLWQLSTSLKSVTDDIYAFPGGLIPAHPTVAAYRSVSRLIPVYRYAFHSLLVAVATVVTNVLFSTMAGYAMGIMRFRGKKAVMGLFLSTLLLPGEVTLTSQYLIVKNLGLANTLAGVFIPGAIGAVNVLLMATACRSVPPEVLDAATVDGASTWQKVRHIVWPNVRGMASVVAVFAFIGAWDDFLWPLIVLSDPSKYTLTVGMSYLNASFGADPREIAAGTIIALVPIIIVFSFTQRFFFRGVEAGAVKG